MSVVLCDPDDTAALWLVQRLREAGDDCALVTSDLLSFARRRSQRIGRAGVSALVDVDGRIVIGHPDLLINRMSAPPMAAWRTAPPVERDYATAELTAFVLSWLDGLSCPVRNRPDPSCLAGPAPHPLRAGLLASAAGLACPDVRLQTDRGTRAGGQPLLEAALRQAGPGARLLHVVVLDGTLVDPEGVARQAGAPVPAGFAPGIQRLCASLGAAEALAGIDVVVTGEQWMFAGFTPLPDLPVAGGALVRALARVRESAAEREKVTA
ncbi:hypothetical protein LK09_03810 [Microbacterium mangrovi]|uniref:Uncharacterized protein n=1 Tax=Microbacterium mangrovi TaxID=1348253 RepID=A0A0B2A7R4_9MICO|nr:hypothetical protein [Microbacterium mangrovi]KHK99145.1 hypothetical protein LK09_03810 [Microbacterium mangrovi]